MTIKENTNPLIISLYNDNNGYYPHKIWIEYPGYFTTNDDYL